MSLSFSRYVRFVFHACPVLSLRVSSLHLPSCRLAALSFVSLSFPLRSPCFYFCPFHVPFSSPLFSFHFPLLSCRLPIYSPPYFLALPCISPVLPSISRKKKTLFFQRFRKKDVQKHRVFPDFRQKEKELAGGFEPGTPVWRHRLPEDYVERHQITARYVGEPPPPPHSLRIRRRGGGLGRARRTFSALMKNPFVGKLKS